MKYKLKKAQLTYKPEEFVRRTFLTSFYMSFGMIFAFGMMLAKFEKLQAWMLILIPIIMFGLFAYMMRFPDVLILKKAKEISKEIVFAGRYLMIELQSGVPLYNAFINVSKNYEHIGTYFKQIVDKVDFGTSMEDALQEAVEYVPSEDFRRILWQILNSMRTGSEIGSSLESVIEQISREQVIMVNEYGRKLNPMAMFYMIMAVIMPTLGITLLIVLSSFIEFELSLTILLFIAMMLGFMQFMFLSMIKFSRPPVEF